MKGTFIDRFLQTLALAVVMGASVAGVWAQVIESGTGEARFVQQVDQDGDGLVSADEFPWGDDPFSRLDTNGAGYLDASEAPQRPVNAGCDEEEWSAEFDADGDGQISPDEFPGATNHFDHLDTDANGFLSVAEMMAGRPPEPPRGDGFKRDDADQDGRVSQAEFRGPADFFNRLDTDGDGYITMEEVHSPAISGKTLGK